MKNYAITSFSVPSQEGFAKNKDCKFVDYNRAVAIIADGISGCSAGMQAAYNAVHIAKLQLRNLTDDLRNDTIPPQRLREVMDHAFFGVNDVMTNLYKNLPDRMNDYIAHQAAHQAVDQARLQLSTIIDYLHQNGKDVENIHSFVEGAVAFTNQMMLSISKSVPEYQGWGTTLDCCVIYDNNAYICHVGDGRVYHLKDDCSVLEQVTIDHSFLPMDLSSLSAKEQKIAQLNAKLSEYIGKENAKIDTRDIQLNAGDIILMVTDGITRLLTDEALLEIFKNADFGKVKHILLKQLRAPTAFVHEYAEFKGISPEDAYKRLVDDRTMIAIKRLK